MAVIEGGRRFGSGTSHDHVLQKPTLNRRGVLSLASKAAALAVGGALLPRVSHESPAPLVTLPPPHLSAWFSGAVAQNRRISLISEQKDTGMDEYFKALIPQSEFSKTSTLLFDKIFSPPNTSSSKLRMGELLQCAFDSANQQCESSKFGLLQDENALMIAATSLAYVVGPFAHESAPAGKVLTYRMAKKSNNNRPLNPSLSDQYSDRVLFPYPAPPSSDGNYGDYGGEAGADKLTHIMTSFYLATMLRLAKNQPDLAPFVGSIPVSVSNTLGPDKTTALLGYLNELAQSAKALRTSQPIDPQSVWDTYANNVGIKAAQLYESEGFEATKDYLNKREHYNSQADT